MKHDSLMENVGCISNLSDIKGEGMHREKKKTQLINNNESLLAD